jgi:hypothetical protein
MTNSRLASPRIWFAGSIVLALGLLASACGGSSGVSATASSPGMLLRSVKSALAKEHGVHLTVKAKASPTAPEESVVADFGRNEGDETITEGNASLTVRLLPKAAYVSGSKAGLEELLGMDAQETAKARGHWMVFQASSSPYKDFQSSVTISSIVSQLPPVKGTKASTTVIKGTREDLLSWTTAATSSEPKLSNTLTIASDLPQRQESKSSTGSLTEVFSHWGEHVLVSPPPSSSTIPYTDITSSS